MLLPLAILARAGEQAKAVRLESADFIYTVQKTPAGED
jgi:hypothetical protein